MNQYEDENGACLLCGVRHGGAHPLYPCGCGHCSRWHSGSYGYGDCGKEGCECTWFRR